MIFRSAGDHRLPQSRHQNQSLTERLQELLEAEVSDSVGQCADYSLLDFPNHSNVGDSAIYVGEILLLKTLFGRGPSLVTEATDRALDQLALMPPANPVFLHGGGNFGDLWPRHQLFREAVMRRFPDRRIIQLPQSIHFADEANLQRAATAVNSHPNFTLMVRDEASASIAKTVFTCDVRLVPDAAFMIGPITAAKLPDYKILCLLREDKEKVFQGPDPIKDLPPSSIVIDWRPERWRRNPLDHLPQSLRRLLPPFAQSYRPTTPRAFEQLAKWRVQRGIDLLTRGEIVITDRLHAHILCVLLGKPHVVLDNSYGKIRSFMAAFTADADVPQAASLREAVKFASSNKLQP